jgi:Tol biopolymer transport system component
VCGVYVVRPDGSGLRQIGKGASPQWSPDSTRLLYFTRTGIAVTGLDGRAQTIAYGDSATWSPDSATIAYAQVDDEPQKSGWASSSLWLVGPDGQNRRELVQGGPMTDPEWSPDGSWIAVNEELISGSADNFIDDGPAFALINPATGAERLLLSSNPSQYRWSPDSRTILATNQWTIRTIDIATGSARTIAAREKNVRYPEVAWSPDGTQIAYIRDVYANGYTHGDVWTANPDGSNRHRMSQTLSAEQGLAWAP